MVRHRAIFNILGYVGRLCLSKVNIHNIFSFSDKSNQVQLTIGCRTITCAVHNMLDGIARSQSNVLTLIWFPARAIAKCYWDKSETRPCGRERENGMSERKKEKKKKIQKKKTNHHDPANKFRSYWLRAVFNFQTSTHK